MVQDQFHVFNSWGLEAFVFSRSHLFLSICVSVWEWGIGLVKSHSVSTLHEARRRRNVKDKCLSERLCFPPSDSLSSPPPFHSTAVHYSHSLCQPALSLAPFLSHILTLCFFLSLPRPVSFPSILFSVTLSTHPLRHHMAFSHIFWMTYGSCILETPCLEKLSGLLPVH